MKIAVGMSGGVDSTVTAYLLKQAGHEVKGVTMQIWDNSIPVVYKRSACFGADEAEDIEKLKKITKMLDIPLSVIDLAREYKKNVLAYFKDEYLKGRTPNPCLKCNSLVKFQLLLKKAREAGLNFDYFATGHYARIEYVEKRKHYLLKKGQDHDKDQSYFLALLNQKQLAQIIFPLGSYTKAEVKKTAKGLNLGLNLKKESQDFYAGDYTELLEQLPVQGDIIDKQGRVLGRHKGICFYTIGQRRGLGISYTEPLYVIKINTHDNTIVVGTEDELLGRGLIAGNINWIAINGLKQALELKVRIRYRHQEAAARVNPLAGNRVRVIFKKPQRAITPGQFAVFYDDDVVVGGGVIE